MRIKKMIAGLALGMSLVMSVNAFAAGSITGILENVEADFSGATDSQGNAIEADGLSLHIVEEFEANYFATDAGKAVLADINSMNDGTKTLETAVSQVKKDDDVAVKLSDLGFLTKVSAVVVKNQDGTILEDAKNVGVSFELNNIPDDAELYVLMYNATDGWALRKVKAGAVLGDAVYAVLDGNRMTLLFSDIQGAAFSVLYKSSENASAPTGDFGPVFPAVIAIIAAGSAAVVFFRKKNA